MSDNIQKDEESSWRINPLWFLHGISMSQELFEKRQSVLVKELAGCLTKNGLAYKIGVYGNWLLQCWAYAFFHLKKQANVGYSGHKKSLRDGVFSNVGDVDWTKIWSVIFSFLKKEYPGQIVENDTEKWFFKNCWLVAPRDDGRVWATMVTRVLGYAEYLKGNGSLDVDEIVGNGYFCSTLENQELLEGCKNAITKEGAIGYDVITSAIKGFECVRGDRIFRDGYWCYNSFRRGIDLVFRRSNGASQDGITLTLKFGNNNDILISTITDVGCRFKLEDILKKGEGSGIKRIFRQGSQENLLTEEIKEGFELLKDMSDVSECGLVAFAARTTSALHPLLVTNSKDFDCARLSNGVWLAGYEANESNAYILEGYKKLLFASYISLDPTKEDKDFDYKGKLKFKYKSSYQEKTVIGLDSDLRVFKENEDVRIPAFSKESVTIFKGGEQCGTISGSNDNTVAISRCDSQRYVYIPVGLREKIKEGRQASGGNWKYTPAYQTLKELAITGVRKGEITATTKDGELRLLAELEIENNRTEFWVEKAGDILSDSQLTIKDDSTLEAYKLCIVPARRYSNCQTDHTKVKCCYQDKTRNEEFDFSDSELIIDAKTLTDLSDTVFYEDVRKRSIPYGVLKVPFNVLLHRRNKEPLIREMDRIEAGSARVAVWNQPKTVVFSSRNGEMGVYIPDVEREETLLLVSEKWLDVPGQMNDCKDLCKAVNFSEFNQSQDGWHSIEKMLTDFGEGVGIYATVLPDKFIKQAMANYSQFQLLVNCGMIKWQSVKSATLDVSYSNFEVIERKLKIIGAFNGNNGFDAAIRAFTSRGLSQATFQSHWETIGKDKLRDFLAEALNHGINFLAVGGDDGDENAWYRKTWLSNVFADLCHRELGAQMSSQEVDEILNDLSSFCMPNGDSVRSNSSEARRRKVLEKTRSVVDILQGNFHLLSSALTSFLLESGRLCGDGRRSIWPRNFENQQEFLSRTQSWRKSGVAPLKSLAKVVDNNKFLDSRILPFYGDGYVNNKQYQRDFFVGTGRLAEYPLRQELGTKEECCCFAKAAENWCNELSSDIMRKSSVTRVLAGLFDNIKGHVENANPQCLKAELLFVAVCISRTTAFLNGRANVVSPELMKKVDEIVKKAFNDSNAWKLVMFYTTAVDMLVWLGTEVDKNKIDKL